MSDVLTLQWNMWHVVKMHMETDSRFKSRPVFLTNNCKPSIGGHIHTQIYQKDRGHAHELAPLRAWAYSRSECVDGVYLCGPPAERPTWVIPAAVLSHSKHMTTGWFSKPLSSICLIWAFCLHLFSAPRLKAAALPLFASLLGSEENDNNEGWRQSTASHTNIHTYTRNTDDTHNLTRPVLQQAHTHAYLHTSTHAMWNECR